MIYGSIRSSMGPYGWPEVEQKRTGQIETQITSDRDLFGGLCRGIGNPIFDVVDIKQIVNHKDNNNINSINTLLERQGTPPERCTLNNDAYIIGKHPYHTR